jgi:hypothetical protein
MPSVVRPGDLRFYIQVPKLESEKIINGSQTRMVADREGDYNFVRDFVPAYWLLRRGNETVELFCDCCVLNEKLI